MRYIEISGKIDENNRLILDEALDIIKPQRVKIDIWFRDEEEYKEQTKEEILDSIRQGLSESQSGNTSPISELWDDIKIKTTGEINDKGQLILDRPLEKTQPQYVDVVIHFLTNGNIEQNVSQLDYLVLVK